MGCGQAWLEGWGSIRIEAVKEAWELVSGEGPRCGI